MPRTSSLELTDPLIRKARRMAAELNERRALTDGKCRGLELRLTPSAAVWSFRYVSPEGRTLRTRIGDYPGVGLADAREAAEELRKAVRKERRDPQAEKRAAVIAAKTAAANVQTFADVAERYWRHAVRSKAPKTLESERQRLDTHILPALGVLPFEQITKPVVYDLADTILARGAGVTANRCVSLISTIYSFAEDKLGIVVPNPARFKRRIFEETPRERTLSDDELRRFWSALVDARTPRPIGQKRTWDGLSPAAAIALSLVLVTLQRPGEVLGMRADEIDREARLWLIPAARMKGAREHAVPLSTLALDLVDEAASLAGESPWLFPAGARPRHTETPEKKVAVSPHLTRHALSRAMARVTRGQTVGRRKPQGGLAIPNATPHDLRRTGRTLMTSERLGVSYETAERVIAHLVGSAVSRTYDRNAYLIEKRRALDGWAILLSFIVGTEAASSSNVVALAGRAS